MDNKKLNLRKSDLDGTKTIHHIIHISDIHIGSGTRSIEYRKIFDKINGAIREYNPKDRLLVCISGDIFHYKVKYSGEDVDDFNYLMKCLEEVTVIIIPGNHDTNLNNKENIDLITPLITKLKNICYWKDSGKYKLFGLEFLHISVYDTSTTEEILKLVKDNPLSIVLYHGMVVGAKTGEIMITGVKITKEIIDSAYMMILGDIHEHQFITPHAGYAGSLIQQNVGESMEKGFILWNMETRSGKFMKVENENIYIKLDFRGKTREEYEKIIGNVATCGRATKMPQKILKLFHPVKNWVRS